MPRYELPGPGLGVGMISESKVLQDLSRGSALRPCLFFCPDRTGILSLKIHLQSCRFVRRADFLPAVESPY